MISTLSSKFVLKCSKVNILRNIDSCVFLGLKRIEIYKYKTYTLLILLLIKFLSSDLYSANGKGKT